MRYFLAFLALLSVTSSTISPRRAAHPQTSYGLAAVHTMDGGTPIPKH